MREYNEKKYVVICYDEIIAETEKAIKVQGVWLPKSQLQVVLNYQHLNIDTKEVKEFKVKSVYCLLLPLWLYLKNNMCDKRGYKLNEYMKDINVDMRTNVEYEPFISVSYQDYKENYKK